VLLDGAETDDLKVLAQKADRLWVTRGARVATVAAVADNQQLDEDSECVAAIKQQQQPLRRSTLVTTTSRRGQQVDQWRQQQRRYRRWQLQQTRQEEEQPGADLQGSYAVRGRRVQLPGSAELQVAGKLSGRVVAAAATNLGRPGRLALLMDVKSNSSFLVDTGSVYSIIPHHSSDKPTGPAITTANGKPIQCWGTVVKTVTVGHTRFQWTFLLAAISFHIVGADFLENFGLSWWTYVGED
jgi:hypothetical protein